MPPSLAVLKSNFKETMVSSAAIDPICVMSKKTRLQKWHGGCAASLPLVLKVFMLESIFRHIYCILSEL